MERILYEVTMLYDAPPQYYAIKQFISLKITMRPDEISTDTICF